MIRLYYSVSSDGDDTNLQLYSLRQAIRHWVGLLEDFEESGERTDDLHERCVFAIASLGLSLSQLLGQNDPSPPSQRVREMKTIFDSFAESFRFPDWFKAEFSDFNNAYNGVRHFGVTATPGAGHQRANDLTFAETDRLFRCGIDVWRTIVQLLIQDRAHWENFEGELWRLAQRYPPRRTFNIITVDRRETWGESGDTADAVEDPPF